jgi:biopolymer transport protein ExbD
LNQEDDRHGLRIAPLIDVIFLLLIFFLVATTFYEVEKDITIDLAEATEGTDRKTSDRIIIVNVKQSGIIVVNQRVRTHEQLREDLIAARGRDPAVAAVVRCDRHTYHKHFVRILDLCEKVGVTSVAVAILQNEE